ncbi:hypothetical protein [Nocardioides panacisoli]
MKHRVVRAARPVMMVAVGALMLGFTLGSAPASATSGNPIDKNFNIITKTDDTRSNATCVFKVSSVNVQGGTATGKLSASASPKGFLNSFGNKEVGVICLLRDAGGNVLASKSVHANKPTILQTSDTVTVPRLDGYELCTAVSTETGSGQIFGNAVCTNSF